MGIMASVALTSFAQGKRDIVIETVHRRNAQAFATIAECAQLSGADPVIGTDVEATLKNIVAGVTATDGALKGRTFRIFGLSDNDVTTVEMLLELEQADYVSMGLGLAIVRTMLRKAAEIVNTTAQSIGDDDTSSEMILLPMDD